MYLLIILLAVLWIGKRNQAARGSAATLSGGWHIPQQTIGLGGANLDGNTWDNGTTRPTFNSQWSGYDPPVGNVVFAVQGGEDGLNPAQPMTQLPSSQVTTLPRFNLIGGGDPLRPPDVPVQVSTINDVVRR